MPTGRPPSASSLDAISPVQIDPLAGMTSLSIGGSAAPHTQSMQGFPPNLGSAFSTPQSPAKAFPPLSTPNQTTAFSGIGGLSSQLPVGGLGTGNLTGIGTGALGLPAVNNNPFVQRKLGTSGLKQPTFQQSKKKPSDLSQVWPEANQHFSKEVHDEANSYFQ
ncbi:CCR4-NOT transcription complex subunit 1 [Plecturocebus cupreus]